jgi:hypothetical protein
MIFPFDTDSASLANTLPTFLSIKKPPHYESAMALSIQAKDLKLFPCHVAQTFRIFCCGLYLHLIFTSI